MAKIEKDWVSLEIPRSWNWRKWQWRHWSCLWGAHGAGGGWKWLLWIPGVFCPWRQSSFWWRCLPKDVNKRRKKWNLFWGMGFFWRVSMSFWEETSGWNAFWLRFGLVSSVSLSEPIQSEVLKEPANWGRHSACNLFKIQTEITKWRRKNKTNQDHFSYSFKGQLCHVIGINRTILNHFPLFLPSETIQMERMLLWI